MSSNVSAEKKIVKVIEESDLKSRVHDLLDQIWVDADSELEEVAEIAEPEFVRI